MATWRISSILGSTGDEPSRLIKSGGQEIVDPAVGTLLEPDDVLNTGSKRLELQQLGRANDDEPEERLVVTSRVQAGSELRFESDPPAVALNPLVGSVWMSRSADAPFAPHSKAGGGCNELTGISIMASASREAATVHYSLEGDDALFNRDSAGNYVQLGVVPAGNKTVIEADPTTGPGAIRMTDISPFEAEELNALTAGLFD